MNNGWNSIMFDYIGLKIQSVAKTIIWINIAISIISGIVMFFYALTDLENLWHLIFISPVSIVVGCAAAWLSNIILYGFGKLVEDVEYLRTQKSDSLYKEAQEQKETPTLRETPALREASHCRCGEIFYGRYCPVCGEKSRN